MVHSGPWGEVPGWQNGGIGLFFKAESGIDIFLHVEYGIGSTPRNRNLYQNKGGKRKQKIKAEAE